MSTMLELESSSIVDIRPKFPQFKSFSLLSLLVCSFQMNSSHIVHLSSFSLHAEEKRKDERYKKKLKRILYYITRYTTKNCSSFLLDHLRSKEKHSQKEWHRILHFFKRKIRFSQEFQNRMVGIRYLNSSTISLTSRLTVSFTIVSRAVIK